MKVDLATIAYIQNAVEAANTIGMESVIIEPGRVRAVDEDSTVMILHTDNVPTLPFGSVGINRISTFTARLSMGRAMANFEIDAVADGPEDAQYLRSLTVKAKGTKIEYRCANPATIRAPKGLNDTAKYRVAMTADAVSLMAKGKDAMQSADVTITGSNKGVWFEMVDINGDKLSYQFGDSVDLVSSTDVDTPSFSHRYPIKLMLTLFKQPADKDFFITSRGLLKTATKGLDIYVLPRK